MKPIIYLTISILFITTACKDEEADPIAPEACEDTNYTYSEVRSIFDNNCTGCHSDGEEGVAAGDFTTYQGISDVISSNTSQFISVLKSTDENVRMPPAENLSNSDIQKLECWIDAGYPN
mgnify:CR=1 FL=1